MTSYPVPIPSRYYSNIIGLQLNEHTFDILGHGISHVAQFGSTLNEMDMRLFVQANENIGYGFKISQSNQQPVFRIGYWDSNIKDYRTQIFLDPSTGINFVDDVAFPGNDIYFTGNLGVGTSSPLERVHIEGYKLDINGSLYAKGTLFASNLVVYGDSVILQTTTCNTEQMIITNAGTGPALVVTQQGQGTQYAIAEFRDLDESNVAMIIADGGNVGIGTRYPFQELDVRGTVIVSNNLGIGTSQPQNGFQVYGKDASFTNNVGIGITTPRTPLDVLGIASISTNLGIGTTQPLGALHVELAPSYLKANVGIGTTLPRQALHVQGSIYATASIGIGTTQPRQTLDIVGANAIFSNNIGIGTTNPRKALDILGEGIIANNLGIGTTSPRKALDVQGDILTSTNLGIGTTTPRKALDVLGEGIITNNLGIGTASPRKALDIVGDAIFSTNVGIGTTLPKAPFYIESGPAVLQRGNLGIGTLTPTNALHVQDSIRLANKRLSYRLPLSSAFQTIHFFKYQYTSFAPFYIRIHGQVHSGYNSMYIDVHFGGRYGYGIRTQHASVYGTLKNLVGTDVSSAFQIKFCKRNSVVDEYLGYLVLNEGMSEMIGIDLNFDVHDGEDTFTWSSSGGLPVDVSIFWNATQDAQMIEYDTHRYQRDPVLIGTTSTDAWLNIKGFATSNLTLIQGQPLNASVDYLNLLNPVNLPVLKVASSTNIGIGTASPQYKLDIYGNTHITTILQVDQNIGIGTSTPRKALDVIGDGIFTTNIGIGTTLPIQSLHVQGKGYVSSYLGIGTASPQVDLHIGTAIPTVKLEGTTSGNLININDSSYLRFGSDQSYKTHVLVVADGFAGGAGGRVNFRYKNYMAFDVVNGVSGTGIEKARFDAIGNLGIGTSSPRQLLDVIGDAIVSNNIGIGITTPRAKLDVVGRVLLGNIGIGTTLPAQVPLAIYDTTAILLPKGTTGERPSPTQIGYVRYNTSTEQFEGFGPGNQWGSLGGVKDVNGDTYISAELTPGTNDDTLRFINSNVESMRIQKDGNVGIGTQVAFTKLMLLTPDAYSGHSIRVASKASPTNYYWNLTAKNPETNVMTHHVTIANNGTLYDNVVSIEGSRVGFGTDRPRKPLDVIGDIISTTNIGIGTVTPRYALDVIGTGILTGTMGIGTTTPRKSLDVIGDIIATVNIGIGTTLPRHSLHTESTSYLRGNVGIGTYTPLSALSLGSGTGDTSSALLFNSADTATGMDKIYFTYLTNGSRIAHAGGWNVLMYAGQSNVGSLNGNFRFYTGGSTYTEQLTILKDGNIGIGTSTPRKTLDVMGDGIFTTNIGIGTTTPRKALDVMGDGIFTTNIGIGTTEPRKSLDVVGTGIFTTNIGIGTTTPRKALDVMGDGIFTTNIGIGTITPRHALDIMGVAIVSNSIGIGTTTLPRKSLDVIGDIISSTNIGIGTTAPRYALDVIGNGILTGTMGIGTTNARKSLDVIGDIIASTNIGIGTTLPLHALHVEGKSYIQANLGIGTTLPQYSLDVYGNTRIGTGLNGLTILPGQIYNGTASVVQSNAVWIDLPNTGTISFSDNLILNGGNLGLGTTLPASLLSVSGGATIGTSYQGISAPSQSLLVQGNIGVGTTRPRSTVDIQGILLASSHIGIGTTLPKLTLDVTGQATISQNIGVGTSLPRHALDIMGIAIVSNGIGIGTTTLPRKSLDVIGDIISSTNIGIGTTTPRKALDVMGDIIASTNIGIGTVTPRKALDVIGDGIFSTNIGIGTTLPKTPLDVMGNMLLSGNVGLGTTTTTKGRLHVVGDINVQAGSVQFIDTDPGTMVEKYYNLGDRYGIGQYASGTFRAYVSDISATSSFRVSRYKTDGSFTDMVTVNPDGNVGIGLVTPGERLEIAGTARISNGLIQSKDTLVGMAFPQGIVRRKFTHSKLTYPNNANEMRDYFASGLVYVESVVVSTIQQSISIGDYYAYEFIGYIYADVEGTYTFDVNTDDAGEVFIDGKLTSDYYGIHSQNDDGNKRTAYLTHGLHSIVLRTQERDGGDGVLLSWKKPGNANFVIVPSTAYYYDPKDLFYTVQSQLVYTQGNVGIGTLSPRALLDVQGNAYIATNIGVGTTNPRKSLDVIGDIIATTNIGIGTTLPRTSLHVVGDAFIANTLGIGTTNISTGILNVAGGVYQANLTTTSLTSTSPISDYPFVLHAVDGSSQPDSAPRNAIAFTTITNAITTQTPGATIQFRRAGASGYGALDLCTKDLPSSLADVLPRITILTSNVGIGTTNPLDRMHIRGNTIIQDGNLGIGTTYSRVGLSIFRTDSVLIAKGTTNERPTGVKGYIRYNTELDQFEGFGAGNTWGTLGGVKSADGLTYISAELSAGTNDSNLRFFTAGVQRAIINPYGNLGIGTTQPHELFHNTGTGLIEGNLGVGTTTPRKRLDVVGEAIFTANIGIGTITPRKQLDIEGEAIISQRLGIGTTTPALGFALDVAGSSRFLNPLDITATEIQIALDTQSATLSRHSLERVDLGWSEVGGADIELFSKSHTTRPGDLVFTYGGSPTMGQVTLNQYDGTSWNIYATLDAKGNLGIGEHVPLEKLHVNGKIRASSLLGSRAVFTDANKNLETGDTTATQIHYLSNLSSDVQAQIDTKFDKAGGTILGNITVNCNVFVHDTLFTSNLRVLGQYVIIDTATSNTDQLVIFNDGTGPALFVSQAGVQPIAKFIDHDSNIGMLIDNDGYVGLGTEYPMHRLHVEGSGYFNPSVGIGILTPRASLDVMGTILTSANIGIGTTNPASSLHVWGDIYANSIHFKRSTNGYSDAIIQHTPNDDVVIQNTVYDKELFFKTDTVDGTRNIVSIGKIHPEVHVLGTTDFIADHANFIISGTNSNVGIGTLTPVHTLEIFGTTYATKLTLTDRQHLSYDLNFPLNASIGSHGDDYANLKMPNSGRDMVLSANTFQIKTDSSGIIGTTRMTMDGQGNLGIGTTTPRHRLDVENGDALFAGNVGLGTTTFMNVKFEVHSTDSMLIPKGSSSERPTGIKGYIRFNTDNDQFEGFGAGNTWGTLGGSKSTDGLTYITTELNAGANDCNIRFYTSGQLQMIVNPNGNVGIGTTLPTSALDLKRLRLVNTNSYGQIQIAREFDSGYLMYLEGTGTIGNTSLRLRNNSGTNGGTALELGANDLRFYVNTYTTERMRLSLTGNLGIGTNAPNSRLHVLGNTYLSSNLLLGNGGSDVSSILMFNSADLATNTDKLYWTYITNGSKIGHSAGWNVNHYAGQSNTAVAPSNGNFHFFTGGPTYNERFTIMNNGNIGIGTTAPRASLEIVNSLLIPYGNLGIGTTLPLHSMDIEGSLIVRNGNIGIGTTLMSLPLEIWNTKAMLIPTGTDAERPSSNIRKGYIRYNTTTDQFEGYGAGNQWGTLGGIKDVNGDTYISAELAPATNDDNLRFITSNTEQVRIDKYGNVGIGTNLPLGLLHIYDRDSSRNTVLLNWDSSSGTRYAKIKVPTNSYLNPTILDTNNSWQFQTNTTQRVTIDDTGIVSHNRMFLNNGASNSPSLTFTSDTSTGLYLPSTLELGFTTSNVEQLRILSNGNVGIGTNAPEKKLQVNGNVHLGASKLGASTHRNGGPFFKQSSWDSPTATHTISYAEYCEGDNSAGNLHIQVSNKIETGSAKIGNVMVSFIKRFGDGVNLFVISHHKSPQLNTLNITANGDNVQVVTDNDCSIAWTSIGAY
jgi:hypothetical protein